MLNKILNAVTNRNLPNTPAFRFGGAFYPMWPDPHRSLRQAMGLDRTDYEYFVLGVLAAIDSFPALAAELQETGRTFHLSELRAPSISFSGLVLKPSSKDLPELTREAGDNFDPIISFSYVDAATLAVTIDGVVYPMPVTVSGERLIPQPNAAPINIKGLLEVQAPQTWGTGFTGSITYYPPFPYGKIAAAFERDRSHLPLLLKFNLTDNYLFAESDMERVAVVATAVGLSNTSVYVG